MLSSLFDQQLWYVGRDIVSPQGNPLLDHHGFQRIRVPPGCSGSTAYLRLNATTGHALVLWGFALYTGPVAAPSDETTAAFHDHDRGVLFARSHTPPDWTGLSPRIVQQRVVLPFWCPSQMPERDLPQSEPQRARALDAIATVARFFSRYERSILETHGVAHRRTAHNERPREQRRRMHSPYDAMAEQWDVVARGGRSRAIRAVARQQLRDTSLPHAAVRQQPLEHA